MGENSIYCLDCVSLTDDEYIRGRVVYCQAYNKPLRLESMPGTHHKGLPYPVKCLDCIQGISGNYVK